MPIGYAGFNGLFGEDKADEQACMVHVRRKFVEAFERSGADTLKNSGRTNFLSTRLSSGGGHRLPRVHRLASELAKRVS